MTGSGPLLRRRDAWLLLLVAAGCMGCTGAGTSSADQPPSVSVSPVAMISVAGHPYEQECQPVAEALVDVRVSDPGLQPFARAISGLWYRQAVAVAVHERGSPCGLWTLAISPT